MKIFINLAFVFGVSFASSCIAGSIWSELSIDQQSQIEAGKSVVLTEEVGNAPWPRISVYKLIKATSEEAAAVFWDVEDQKNYMDRMMDSRILKQVSPKEIEVFYHTKLPFPLGNDRSSFRNKLSSLVPSEYKIEWTLVSSNNAKNVDGSTRFEVRRTQAIGCYRVFILPNSSAAGLMRKSAIQKTVDSALALFGQSEKMHATQGAKLATQLERIRKALGRAL